MKNSLIQLVFSKKNLKILLKRKKLLKLMINKFRELILLNDLFFIKIKKKIYFKNY